MVVGYLKGKSAIHIHRQLQGVKKGFPESSFDHAAIVSVRSELMKRQFERT
jgi:hypothetical protein